jgi:hypothetical protein
MRSIADISHTGGARRSGGLRCEWRGYKFCVRRLDELVTHAMVLAQIVGQQ